MCAGFIVGTSYAYSCRQYEFNLQLFSIVELIHISLLAYESRQNKKKTDMLLFMKIIAKGHITANI